MRHLREEDEHGFKGVGVQVRSWEARKQRDRINGPALADQCVNGVSQQKVGLDALRRQRLLGRGAPLLGRDARRLLCGKRLLGRDARSLLCGKRLLGRDARRLLCGKRLFGQGRACLGCLKLLHCEVVAKK